MNLFKCCVLATIVSSTTAVWAQEPGPAAAKSEQIKQEFLSWRFGMFLHFNLGTFVGREWAIGYESPELFNPTKLDCGQWADAAKAAGMKYAVLTVKHT